MFAPRFWNEFALDFRAQKNDWPRFGCFWIARSEPDRGRVTGARGAVLAERD
jgi:hypothetical protein